MNDVERADAETAIRKLTPAMRTALRLAVPCWGRMEVSGRFTTGSGTLRGLRDRDLVHGARTLTPLGELVHEVLAEQFRTSFKDPRV